MRQEPHSEGQKKHKLSGAEKMRANWHEFKGKVQERWGKLTNDELDEIDGRREQLIAKVQKAYGVDEDRAAMEVDAFMEANLSYLNRGRDPNMPGPSDRV